MKDQRLKEKDHQLEESASRVSELEEANTKAFDEITKLKADTKFIEQQREKLAFKIKDNILAQCRVICLEADFGKVGLDQHVKNRSIEIAPLKEEGKDKEPSTPVA